MYRVWDYVSTYSLLLIAGAALALVWVNTDPAAYGAFVHQVIAVNPFVGDLQGEGGDQVRELTVGYLVNDMLMAFFFAIAAKEVWEAVALESGSLRGRRALTPLIATAGGMIGPAVVYLSLAAWLGVTGATWRGWAIPTATDIAFSYLVGRVVFGARHPAVRFLLLLAIADDAGGLAILAVFYPAGPILPGWLALSFGAAVTVYALFNWLPRRLDGSDPLRPVSTRVRRRLSFWPYAAAGAASWYGFQQSGIHPALGLLPIIPAIPHADRGFGVFAEAEAHLKDLLNTIEHGLKIPVEIVLFFFGLVNAGVEIAAAGAPTALVAFGLLVGKPAGIVLFGLAAVRILGLGLPKGMDVRDLVVLGFVAAIGFTVALFVASVAFPAGAVQDAAKMGALLSLSAAVIAVAAGRLLGIKRAE
ncbi:MAG: Na+/H+ antiporter NhaA [Pseudomonadota bacterium]